VTNELAGFVYRFVPGEVDDSSTLLLLHGTGGDENDLLPLGRKLDERAALLSPRGKVLENGASRFFRRHAEGVFDQEDLINRTHELREFVEKAASEYDLDLERIFAVGFSNGANIAASLLLLHPGLLAGAILLRPMVPFEPENPPDLSETPVYLAGGRSDSIVPAENTEQLAQLLREAGAEVQLDWQPRGHDLGDAEIEAARRWLADVVARAD
jgi:phospholipase/carboxylesterase